MKIPFWLYAAGLVLLAWIGVSIHHERKLKAAIKLLKEAEAQAEAMGHEANREKHARERVRLEYQLIKERKRPIHDRIADSYAEYERRRAGL